MPDVSLPPPPKTLMEAILRVQGEAISLQKTAINPHFKSKYVPLDRLMEAVTPVLTKHGLVWLTLPGHQNGTPILHYRLVHALTGEALDGEMPLMLDKQNPQGQGSAITYARRYALMAVLGLVADDDDDGNRATHPPRPTIVMSSDRTMTPEELQILGKAVGESGQKLSLLLASVGAEDLDTLTVDQGRSIMRKISATSSK